MAMALFVLFAMTLLFLIGALLNPVRALQPLVVCGTAVFLVANMWNQFSGLTKNIRHIIDSQLDGVLSTLLDGLVGRLGLDSPSAMEGMALGGQYTMEDLQYAFQTVESRFRGFDTEGKPLKSILHLGLSHVSFSL